MGSGKKQRKRATPKPGPNPSPKRAKPEEEAAAAAEQRAANEAARAAKAQAQADERRKRVAKETEAKRAAEHKRPAKRSPPSDDDDDDSRFVTIDERAKEKAKEAAALAARLAKEKKEKKSPAEDETQETPSPPPTEKKPTPPPKEKQSATPAEETKPSPRPGGKKSPTPPSEEIAPPKKPDSPPKENKKDAADVVMSESGNNTKRKLNKELADDNAPPERDFAQEATDAYWRKERESHGMGRAECIREQNRAEQEHDEYWDRKLAEQDEEDEEARHLADFKHQLAAFRQAHPNEVATDDTLELAYGTNNRRLTLEAVHAYMEAQIAAAARKVIDAEQRKVAEEVQRLNAEKKKKEEELQEKMTLLETLAKQKRNAGKRACSHPTMAHWPPGDIDREFARTLDEQGERDAYIAWACGVTPAKDIAKCYIHLIPTEDEYRVPRLRSAPAPAQAANSTQQPVIIASEGAPAPKTKSKLSCADPVAEVRAYEQYWRNEYPKYVNHQRTMPLRLRDTFDTVWLTAYLDTRVIMRHDGTHATYETVTDEELKALYMTSSINDEVTRLSTFIKSKTPKWPTGCSNEIAVDRMLTYTYKVCRQDKHHADALDKRNAQKDTI